MGMQLHSAAGWRHLARWRAARHVAFKQLLGGVSLVDGYDRRSWHYWVEDDGRPISCARVIRDDLQELPSGKYFIDRRIQLPSGPYAEPSRFGALDHKAFLMVTGAAAYDGYLLGEYWIMTAREILLQSLATYPFHIFGLLDSREMIAGPDTKEPIWLVGVNPAHSLGSVLSLEPRNFSVLFPNVDPNDVGRINDLPTTAEFKALASENARRRQIDKAEWRQRNL